MAAGKHRSLEEGRSLTKGEHQEGIVAGRTLASGRS